MSEYPSTAFTVVSADNLDFLHSYARVYSGNQQLSWHGTTIQVVQPQSSLLTDSSVSNFSGLFDLTTQAESFSDPPDGMCHTASSDPPGGMCHTVSSSDPPGGMYHTASSSDLPGDMYHTASSSDPPGDMYHTASSSDSRDHSTDSESDPHLLVVVSPLSNSPFEDDVDASLQMDQENPLEREGKHLLRLQQMQQLLNQQPHIIQVLMRNT